MQKVYTGWYVCGIDERGRFEVSLCGYYFDRFIFLNIFYAALLQDNATHIFKRLCQCMHILYRVKFSLLFNQNGFFVLNIINGKRFINCFNAYITAGIMNILQFFYLAICLCIQVSNCILIATVDLI